MRSENTPIDLLEKKLKAQHIEAFRELNEVESLGLQDQFLIGLVFLGMKPTAEISILTYKADDENYIKNIESISQALTKLGLSFEKEIYEPSDEFDDPATWINWYVGKNRTLAHSLKVSFKNDDKEKIGRLLGFPETAIEAFPDKSLDDLPKETQSRWEKNFIYFRPSKEHWRDEFAFTGKQALALREYLPSLFHEIINRRK